MNLKKILECDICRGYIAACLVTPIRCPGKGYREINGESVSYTSTGILWDDYILSFKNMDTLKREAYEKEHKNHLIDHGMMKLENLGLENVIST